MLNLAPKNVSSLLDLRSRGERYICSPAPVLLTGSNEMPWKFNYVGGTTDIDGGWQARIQGGWGHVPPRPSKVGPVPP